MIQMMIAVLKRFMRIKVKLNRVHVHGALRKKAVVGRIESAQAYNDQYFSHRKLQSHL